MLSTCAWFISKHFTYLLQAVPQSKLKSNFRALLCIIIHKKKKKPKQIMFGSISWQHNAAKRILPLENWTCSRAKQYTNHEQSCFLPLAQVQKQPGAPSTPVISNKDHDDFLRRPLPDSQVASFSAGISGVSALPGKAPQAPHPTTTTPEFFQEHVLMVPSHCRNTHLLQLTLCP